MSKKIVVAGGAGFIGSHLVDHLIQDGHKVLVLDSFVTGRKENLQHLNSNENVQQIECDIKDSLPSLLKDEEIDQIYNLASPASPKDFATIGHYILETASIGHRNLLQLATEKKATILYASTSEVYGDPLVHPQKEDYFGNVNPIGARACYDEAKRYGEALSNVFFRTHETAIRIARIFNTYGPRMAPDDGRILPNFFSQSLKNQPLTIYGDGSQTRSYCYVSDLVNGLIALMNSAETQPTNLGNPIERSVKEMADLVNQMTNNTAGVTSLPLPENDPKQRRPDISKAQEVLNWSPKVNLEEGIQKTHEYFKSVIN